MRGPDKESLRRRLVGPRASRLIGYEDSAGLRIMTRTASCAICPNERARRRYSFCVNRDSLKSALMKRQRTFANAAFSEALSHLVAVKSASVKSGRVSARVSKTVIVLVHGSRGELRCEGLRIG